MGIRRGVVHQLQVVVNQGFMSHADNHNPKEPHPTSLGPAQQRTACLLPTTSAIRRMEGSSHKLDKCVTAESMSRLFFLTFMGQ